YGHLAAVFDVQYHLTRRSEFHGVAEKVYENLIETMLVAADITRQLIKHLTAKRETFTLRLRFKHAHHLFDECGKIDRRFLQIEFACLDARNIQNIFNQAR